LDISGALRCPYDSHVETGVYRIKLGTIIKLMQISIKAIVSSV